MTLFAERGDREGGSGRCKKLSLSPLHYKWEGGARRQLVEPYWREPEAELRDPKTVKWHTGHSEIPQLVCFGLL